ADSAGYGPAAAAGGESGGPAARPLQPYSQYAPGAPAQPDAPGYAQQEYAPPQGGYPQQAYRQPGYAPQGYAQQQGYPQQGYAAQANPPPAYAPQSYAPAPWPMSPAAQAAQRDAYRQPAAKRGAARRPARANRAAQQPAYAQGGYPQPGDAQPAYAPYPQQGYAPPYPQGGYPQGGYPQQPAYAPNGYARPPYPAYNPQPPYPQPAQGPDYIPPPPAGYAQPYAPAAVAAEAAPQPSANPQTVGVADELAAINREQSSSVSAGLVLRNRAGEDGLSTLNDIEAPIEGRIKAGNGHLVITATPVTLDSGTGVDDIPTHARFGSGLSQTASPAGGYGSQTAMGVGVSLGYETKSIKADLGSTPVGFRYQTAVGGLEYHGGFNDKVSYSLAVTRRAVTDSLLSYAGARDAATGQQWGGVTKSGGRAALGWDDGTNGLYVNGELMYYAGHHVANNIGGKAGGGFYTRLYKDAQQTLTAGVNATWMSFDKNQSYFTYGQGGYFSPQQYVILNIPLEYAGRSGPFTYDLKGSAGLQHYRQNAARYFPLDPGLDSSAAANRNAATAANPTLVLDSNAVYPGQSKTSFSYSLYASGEYQLAPQVAVGAMASYGNAYQYREWLAAVYLRYSFTPQSGAPLFPPRKFSSPYLADSD
ncbi:cellulose synthase subunit BcsC-related outer membrane protein, partial [Burkholderia glumae]